MKNLFFAFYIDNSIGTILRAYTIQHSISISRLFRNIIRKWIDDEELDKEKAINGIANKMYLDWQLRDMETKNGKSGKIFHEDWEHKLRKLPAEAVNEIFNQYETNKQGTTEHPGEE